MHTHAFMLARAGHSAQAQYCCGAVRACSVRRCCAAVRCARPAQSTIAHVQQQRLCTRAHICSDAQQQRPCAKVHNCSYTAVEAKHKSRSFDSKFESWRSFVVPFPRYHVCLLCSTLVACDQDKLPIYGTPLCQCAMCLAQANRVLQQERQGLAHAPANFEAYAASAFCHLLLHPRPSNKEPGIPSSLN